jgi:regulator of protease activity HflC (stomatin/prohibitin superfamily)
VHNVDSGKLWMEGRHYVGLGCGFVMFPTYAIDVSQDYVGCRTKDGLSVLVMPSFQYRINQDLKNVTALYNEFGVEYEDILTSFSRSSIRDVVSTFLAYELVSDREVLAANLETTLKSHLGQFGISVVGYQVLSIRWSDEIDTAIMDAVTELENVKTAFAEKNISQIEAFTSVEQAKVLSEETIILANQTANVLVAAKTAEAEIITVEGLAAAEAFKAVKGNITDGTDGSAMTTDQLLRYIYLESMINTDFKSRSVAVGVPSDIQTTVDGL